ncbi:MAG: hypothetical protein NZZ60_00880 [Bacteroidia bacterium]|nr:hypothetical protein [Bacteroidia bacterium]MCX7652102.1 hypothetical protein [Bacteroidia bacterium]MDW8417129.1 hypothetical protein [Bacteroidia bacterium]
MERNALYYLVGNILQRSYPLLETILLTLLLPVEDFGRWTWAAGFYMGMASLAHGGIPAATLRYAAVERHAPLAVLHRALISLIPWGIGGGIGLFFLSLSVPSSVRWIIWLHIPALLSTLVGETARAYLRGRLADRQILLWQLVSFSLGLFLIGILSSWYGLAGAAWGRAFQPVWSLLPIVSLLWSAFRSPPVRLIGFGRFSLRALWGNLAMEAIFILPVWFMGWHGASEATLAYWRWATLLPFNLRSFLAQVVLYFYPLWAKSQLSPLRLYKRFLPIIHGVAIVGALFLVLLGFVWEYFPGSAYLPARPYYWLSIVVGYIWSTEALTLPNILSAKGYIQHFSWAYLVALLLALSMYSFGGVAIQKYLVGIGLSGITAAFYGIYRMRIISTQASPEKDLG